MCLFLLFTKVKKSKQSKQNKYDKGWRSGSEILKRVGIAPLALEGREGFALFNGIAFSAACAALVAHDAARLVSALELTAGLHGWAAQVTQSLACL